MEVVSEVLCDIECPEEERSEASGVLAQITSPWVENNHRLTALHTHLGPIVAALTGTWLTRLHYDYKYLVYLYA